MPPNSTVVRGSSGQCEEYEYYILGGKDLGSRIAQRLHAAGHSVCVVDETHDTAGTPGLRGNPADVQTLEAAGIGTASTVIVPTKSDSRNLLIAQLVRTRFDVSRIVVLSNTPDRFTVFTDAGHTPVCATAVLSAALVASI